jgi:hypothetical protein
MNVHAASHHEVDESASGIAGTSQRTPTKSTACDTDNTD